MSLVPSTGLLRNAGASYNKVSGVASPCCRDGATMDGVLAGLRPFAPADIEKLSRLIADACAWPPASGDPLPDEIWSRWARWHVEPDREVSVLPGSSGELAAYMRASLVTDPSSRLSFELAVHPEHRQAGIGGALLKLVEERARDLRAPHITAPVYLVEGHERPDSMRFLERRGFFPDRTYLQMSLPDLAHHGFANPPHPQGVAFRSFEHLERDAERWADLVRTAFGEPATAARVAAQVSEPGSSAEGYIFAVDQATGREIGTSRARLETQGGRPAGYVGSVGVLPAFRGRGIGTALVQQTLAYLASRGMQSAFLFVEGNNHRARRLYERMGFRVTYQTVHYWKTLRAREPGAA
jgi:mycothiol synthase